MEERWNQYQNTGKEPNSQSQSSQSRNAGGKLLEDHEYDAFFAPKFDDFAKWYLAEVRKQKRGKTSERSFINSLQGLDRNGKFDLVQGSTDRKLVRAAGGPWIRDLV